MNRNKIIEDLKNYVEGVLKKEDGRNLYFAYKDSLDNVTPQDAFEVFYSKLQEGYEPKEILEILDRVINVFHHSLKDYKWEKPKENSFLDILMKENKALEKKLNEIRPILFDKNIKEKKKELLSKLKELQKFDAHYLKKENILFPYLEKKNKNFEGLTLMWTLHDEARKNIAKMIEYLEKDEFDRDEFNVQIGKLFFSLLGLVHKEEYILFPAAMEVISDDEWEDMNMQSLEYGFPFIDPPRIEKKELDIREFDGMKFKTDTGELSFEQILLIFNNLPVDLSFVDENDKLRFFTKPKDRIFPRSPAAIGRDVRNCHPAKSIHVVEEIIGEFKAGRRDSATFWINFKGRLVLIQYFALRNSKGEYKGVLEVSQDVTEIKKLEGERRLLQWE
ncbi:MAG TPA: PAS domain-containing protein [Tissierellaceae bacterium]